MKGQKPVLWLALSLLIICGGLYFRERDAQAGTGACEWEFIIKVPASCGVPLAEAEVFCQKRAGSQELTCEDSSGTYQVQPGGVITVSVTFTSGSEGTPLSFPLASYNLVGDLMVLVPKMPCLEEPWMIPKYKNPKQLPPLRNSEPLRVAGLQQQ